LAGALLVDPSLLPREARLRGSLRGGPARFGSSRPRTSAGAGALSYPEAVTRNISQKCQETRRSGLSLRMSRVTDETGSQKPWPIPKLQIGQHLIRC
jgi:hypothetical protein